MQSTKELRKEYRSKRDSIPEEQKIQMSWNLCLNLENAIRLKVNCRDVLAFAPIGSEPLLWPLFDKLLASGYRLYFPVTTNGEIVFFGVDGRDALQEGAFHIPEPVDRNHPYQKQLDARTIAIVPGLVFDRNGCRIGYGGGYYDRFLMKHPDIWKMAAGYHLQICDHIPTQAWDIPMDEVVTDRDRITI